MLKFSRLNTLFFPLYKYTVFFASSIPLQPCFFPFCFSLQIYSNRFCGLDNEYDAFSGRKVGLRFPTNLFQNKFLDYYILLS